MRLACSLHDVHRALQEISLKGRVGTYKAREQTRAQFAAQGLALARWMADQFDALGRLQRETLGPEGSTRARTVSMSDNMPERVRVGPVLNQL